MNNKDKLDAIKYICEGILNDEELIYVKATIRIILKSILEVINDREHNDD